MRIGVTHTIGLSWKRARTIERNLSYFCPYCPAHSGLPAASAPRRSSSRARAPVRPSLSGFQYIPQQPNPTTHSKRASGRAGSHSRFGTRCGRGRCPKTGTAKQNDATSKYSPLTRDQHDISERRLAAYQTEPKWLPIGSMSPWAYRRFRCLKTSTESSCSPENLRTES
jgi:hypothetical protein